MKLLAGRLFLAGDAAHIVTPAGGKGMNLAIQDACELADGLLAYFRSGDSVRLDSYSSTRLPVVWQKAEFSHWMLHLLLASQAGTAEAAFDEGLRQARLTRLMSDKEFARASSTVTSFAGSASHRQTGVETELPQSERR